MHVLDENQLREAIEQIVPAPMHARALACLKAGMGFPVTVARLPRLLMPDGSLVRREQASTVLRLLPQSVR